MNVCRCPICGDPLRLPTARKAKRAASGFVWTQAAIDLLRRIEAREETGRAPKMEDFVGPVHRQAARKTFTMEQF